MRNELFIKACYAAAAIAPFTLVQHGSADGFAAQATAGTQAIFGVADGLGANGANDPVDIIRGGIAEVMYGGNVTRGQPLTATTGGLAIAASAGNRIIGFAEVSGVAGDRGSVFIAPGFYGEADT